MLTTLLSLAATYTINTQYAAYPTENERQIITNAQRYWVDCKTLPNYIKKGYSIPIIQYRGQKIIVSFTNEKRTIEHAQEVCNKPEVYR